MASHCSLAGDENAQIQLVSLYCQNRQKGDSGHSAASSAVDPPTQEQLCGCSRSYLNCWTADSMLFLSNMFHLSSRLSLWLKPENDPGLSQQKCGGHLKWQFNSNSLYDNWPSVICAALQPLFLLNVFILLICWFFCFMSNFNWSYC